MPNPLTQAKAPSPGPTADLAARMAEAESGLFVTAEAVEEWVASWLTEGELPPPDPDHIAQALP